MRSRCAQPDVFRAIARRARRAILDRLRGGEQPVRAIAEPVRDDLLRPSRSSFVFYGTRASFASVATAANDTIGSALNRSSKYATGRCDEK